MTTETAVFPWLESWKLAVQGWSRDGSLARAAQDALNLDAVPPALQRLIEQWSEAQWEELPPVELLSSEAMPGAAGAYAISTGTIYLNQSWLESASPQQVQAVLTEELGHHLDGLLNAADTPGDEGEIFSCLLLQVCSVNNGQKFLSHDGSIHLKVGDRILEGEAADNTGWLLTAGNSGFDVGKSLTVLNDQSLIVSGIATGGLALGDRNLPGSGRNNFIGAIDNKGAVKWLKSLTSNTYAEVVKLQSNNNNQIIAAGTFFGRVTIGGSIELGVPGQYGCFIAKFTRDGDLIWARSLDTIGDIDDISISADDQYIISGTYVGSPLLSSAQLPSPTGEDTSNTYIAKILGDGSVDWARGFETDYDWKTSSVNAFLRNGSSAVAINYSGSATIDGKIYVSESEGETDIVLMSFDSNGATQWTRHFQGVGSDRVIDMEATSDGGIILLGDFYDEIKFDSVRGLSANLEHDLFLTKIDQSGTTEWFSQAGGPFQSPYKVLSLEGPNSLSILEDGSSYISGMFYGEAFIDDVLLESQGWDYFVSKVDSNGEFLWSNQL